MGAAVGGYGRKRGRAGPGWGWPWAGGAVRDGYDMGCYRRLSVVGAGLRMIPKLKESWPFRIGGNKIKTFVLSLIRRQVRQPRWEPNNCCIDDKLSVLASAQPAKGKRQGPGKTDGKERLNQAAQSYRTGEGLQYLCSDPFCSSGRLFLYPERQNAVKVTAPCTE